MKSGFVRLLICGLALLLANPVPAYPQDASPQDAPAQAPAQGAATYSPEQLDQLVAPIALYPDPLLSQILMASTYPLEIVEAARWVEDPNNAALKGDQLTQALAPMNWDPSVKSLVPFPQVLKLMDSKLDWTEQLGDAFLAQQAGVMDAVQQLREQAKSTGTLQSTPQQTVSTEGSSVVIEPADPQVVYVPYYDPAVVYGPWLYPDYPPFFFPPPPGFIVGAGFFFGVGFGIVAPFWGWCGWDWDHHDIHIDVNRFNTINRFNITRGDTRFTSTTWQHDPFHRQGVPYRDAASRARFQNAASTARSAAARQQFRGFTPNRGSLAANRSGATGRPVGGIPGNHAQFANHAALPQANAHSPQANRSLPPLPNRQNSTMAMNGTRPRPTMQRPEPPAFSGFGRAPDVRAQAQRGRASLQAMPHPPGGGFRPGPGAGSRPGPAPGAGAGHGGGPANRGGGGGHQPR